MLCRTAPKEGSRDGKGLDIASLLQQTIHSAKTKPKVVSDFGPQCSVQIFGCRNIQNGDPRNNLDLPTTGGMSNIARLQRHLFHIPINTRSRQFLRFHLQDRTSQFKVTPFGLSTAPLKFTCMVKEVKLMAQAFGIRIYHYLDDWWVRAQTKESCHQGTQSLLTLCQELGWVINIQKSELEPKQVSTSWVTNTACCKG